MKPALAALLLLLVAGCGDTDSSKTSDEPTKAASSKPPAATMADTCLGVNPLLPKDELAATRRDWTDLRTQLSALYIAGDAESKLVLGKVDRAAALYENGPSRGQEATDAFSAWTDALQVLKDHGC